MNALEKRIAWLKKKKIPFLLEKNENYIGNGVIVSYRDEPCHCPYRSEEYDKDTGKCWSAGTSFDNMHYHKPEEQTGYKLNKLMVPKRTRKKKVK